MRLCSKFSKHIHKSRGKAELHLRGLRKNLDKNYDGMVYPCGICGGWHIGRRKRKRK